jgi:hypothetical protein
MGNVALGIWKINTILNLGLEALKVGMRRGRLSDDPGNSHQKKEINNFGGNCCAFGQSQFSFLE